MKGKGDLVEHIHVECNITRTDAKTIVEEVFDSIAGSLVEDGRFVYPGFGTFVIRERAARRGRNPHTGEALDIPASKGVHFKASAKLKDSL